MIKMLKWKRGEGCLCAFIGAGFCALTLSLGGCGGSGGSSQNQISLSSLPAVANTATLDELNTLATPSILSANMIRSGIGPLDITGQRYAFSNGSIIVQQLQFAHLGIWINGGVSDGDFSYANLNENPLPHSPENVVPMRAIYNVEADAVFNGVNFYPDGRLTADFSAGTAGTLTGFVTAGGDADNTADDFGADATLNGNPPTINDVIVIQFLEGVISDGEFSGRAVVNLGTGFFRPVVLAEGSFSGRFHDADDYDAASAPREMSGIFGGENLRGGFLGKLQ